MAAAAAFIGSCPKDCSLAAARMELDTKEAGPAVDLFWSWKVRVVWGGCGSSRLLGEFSCSDAGRHKRRDRNVRQAGQSEVRE